MKCKSLLAVASAVVAGSVLAAVVSQNELGRIEINSGTTNTIVAVPFVKVADGGAIPPNEMVLTNNFAAGDILIYKDGETWKAWVMNTSSGWTPTAVNTDGKDYGAAANNATMARGNAIWVIRSSAERPFYIYGQIGANIASTSTTAGTASQPVYNMMGNPNPATAYTLINSSSVLNSASGTPLTGDTIQIPMAGGVGVQEYVYNSSKSKWRKATDQDGIVKMVDAGEVTIAPGQGFWYVSKGGSPTINW